jgi:hypothetical protein
MPMLETLAIDDVIEVAQLDLQKAMAKKSVRQVAGAARNFAGGLRQRMNTIAEGEAVQPGPGKGQVSEAEAVSTSAQAEAPNDDGDAASVTTGPTTDSPADHAAAAKPPRAKQKGRALTSAEGASQASATA